MVDVSKAELLESEVTTASSPDESVPLDAVVADVVRVGITFPVVDRWLNVQEASLFGQRT